MNREIRDKWVKALRSGEYRQGIGELQTEGGRFCCLGVLADLMGWFDDNRYVGKNFAVLPGFELKQIELSDEEQQNLASLNDNGSRFEKIAAYIEEHL